MQIKLVGLLGLGMCLSCMGARVSKCAVSVYEQSDESLLMLVKITPKRGWHTYWVNPGDAGMSVRLRLDEGEGKLEEMSVPHRYNTHGVVTYGYGKAVTFLYTLNGEGLSEGVKGKVSWLVCDASRCVAQSQIIAITEFLPWNAKGRKKVEKIRSTQPRVSSEIEVGEVVRVGNVVTFHLRSERPLSKVVVLPYRKEFTELGGVGRVEKKGEQDYTFTFKLLGAQPHNARFLLKDGRMGYTVTY